MGYDAVEAAITKTLRDEWTSPGGAALSFENQQVGEGVTKLCIAHVMEGEGFKRALGPDSASTRNWRHPGVVMFQIIGPRNEGTAFHSQVRDAIVSILGAGRRIATADGRTIHFRRLNDPGRSLAQVAPPPQTDGERYQRNVSVGFSWDDNN